MYDKFEEDDSSWSFAIGLLVGAVVGAAVASLFTPRSGAQNREAVIEQGLVLRNRVTEATDTVTTKVRDTATTVKDGADRIGAAAGATVERVQEAANTAAATVKDVADRAQTLAGTATEKVQEAANTAAATVSEVAGTVSERAQDAASKVQSVAGAAAERVRQTTGRETVDEFALPAATEGLDEFMIPATEGLDQFESEIADSTGALAPLDVDAIMGLDVDTIEPLDAELLDSLVDSTTMPAGEGLTDKPTRPEPEQLETLASIDTFEGATSTTTVLDTDAAASTPASGEIGANPGEGWLNLESAVEEAQAEVASSEQFVVDEQAAPLGENDQTAAADDRRPA